MLSRACSQACGRQASLLEQEPPHEGHGTIRATPQAPFTTAKCLHANLLLCFIKPCGRKPHTEDKKKGRGDSPIVASRPILLMVENM